MLALYQELQAGIVKVTEAKGRIDDPLNGTITLDEAMMRVCIICASLPPFYGGAELRAYRLAQRLQAVHSIDTVLIGWERAKTQSNDESFPDYVHAVKLRFRESGDLRSAVGGLRWVLHVAEIVLRVAEIVLRLGFLLISLRHKFDVMHVINGANLFNLLSIPLAKALGKPVILEMTLLGSDDPLTLNRRSKQPRQQLFPHRPLKYSLFLMADAYVSKSHALSEAYHQAGLAASNLCQIPSSVDTQRFKPPTPEEKRTVRNKLQLSPDQLIVLFVGGINRRKGIARLLTAFSKIASPYPSVHLLIVGPADQYDPVYIQQNKDNITAWGLGDRVTLIPKYVDNVQEYMKAADVFVLPSSHEGLSMAIMEAMASGLAIVASDIPEIARSQIRNQIEGILVPLGDAEGLAQAMATLCSNPELRKKLGQAARHRVMNEFTMDLVDSLYLRLYESCLQLERTWH